MTNVVNVVELLGQRGFPIAQSLYGQNILKIDMIKNLKLRHGLKIHWHLLGVNIAVDLPNVEVCNYDGVSWSNDIYVNYIERLCKTGERVIVISSFTHEEHNQVMQVGKNMKKYPNSNLVVVLHCPFEELVRNISKPDGDTTFGGASWQNESTLGWIKLLSSGLVDKWVAVSRDVLKSFTKENLEYIGPADIRVITNGVNDLLYRPIDVCEKQYMKASYGISGLTVGTTVGFKRVKGDFILRNILSYYARVRSEKCPTFLLPVLPGYSGKVMLEEIVKLDIRPLLFAGKLRLYFDASQWSGVVNVDELNTKYTDVFHTHIADMKVSDQSILRNAWIGVLHTPIQRMMDLYLRPSISEAFGRGAVEAGLSGSILLVSDRGYMKRYSMSENVITLGRGLTIVHKKDSIGAEYLQDSGRAARLFIERISSYMEYDNDNLMKASEQSVALCKENCPTLEEMLNNWRVLIEDMNDENTSC